MDGLELNMQQTGLDECGQTRAVLVHETLQRIETAVHLGRGRWHEQGVAGTCAADPVLRAPEFAGTFRATPSALEQSRVHLTDQAQGQHVDCRIGGQGWRHEGAHCFSCSRRFDEAA